MLRSAAKVILSKTLQTILSNYLLNIDITSISVTSLKGWEFQVQNVKLQNGAILFRYSIKKKKDKDSLNNDHCDSISHPSQSVTEKEMEVIQVQNEDNFSTSNMHDIDNDESVYTASTFNTPIPPRRVWCNYNTSPAKENTKSTDREREEKEFNIDPTNDNEGDELYEEHEVIVKIGEGGGIGDLSIQLQDEKLYVVIKDAFLVFNIDIISPTSKDDVKKEVEPKQEPQTKNDTSTTNKVDNEKAKAKDIAEIMNGILSSLPYLTLDNCLVRVILSNKENSTANNGDEEDGEKLATETNNDNNDITFEIGIGSFFIDETKTAKDEGEFTPLKLEKSHSDLDVVKVTPQASHHLQRSISDTTTTTTTKTEFSSLSNAFVTNNNSYIYRHIYTGDTFDKGIYMTIIDNGQKYDLNPSKPKSKKYSTNDNNTWAYKVWKSTTNSNLFSLSNFHFYSYCLNTTETYEDNKINESKNIPPIKESHESNIDYYTIDSMLFGVDYIDSNYYYTTHDTIDSEANITSNTTKDSSLSTNLTINEEDKNNYKSNYSKYKGMKRIVTSDPLSNQINTCWSKDEKVELDSSKSSSLPNLILQLSIHNPIEFNFNQYALEQFGTAIDYFSADNTTATKEDEKEETKNEYVNNTSLILLGIECTQLILRMQNTFSFPFHKQFNYSYGYYEIVFNQFLLDVEHTTCSKILFQDCVFVIQSIHLHQYKGVVYSNDLIVLQCDDSDDKNITTTAFLVLDKLLSNNNEVDINDKSLLLMEHNENGVKYALQLRFVLNDNQDTTATLKIASITIDAPFTMIDNMSKTLDDCMHSLYKDTVMNSADRDDNVSLSSFLSTATTKVNKSSKEQEIASNKLQFHLNINQNGSIKFYPNIAITYPYVSITGTTTIPYHEMYTIQSMLNQFAFNIQSNEEECDDTFELWNLPLDIRMRIFLFLDDITYLEEAFGIFQKKKKRRGKNKKWFKRSTSDDTGTTSTFLRFHLLNMKLSSLQPIILSNTTTATTNSMSDT